MKHIEPMGAPPWEVYSPGGLLELMAGNQDAAKFITDIAAVSHIYDDLVDADKPVPPAAAHDLVWRLMFEIPVNPFFCTHQAALRPVLITSILNWRAANDMERGAAIEELRISHVTRYALADVVLICMLLAGGKEHAERNARRARLMGQNDTWANYRSEHFPKENMNADTHKV
jgi:hypothetical protein